MIEKLVNEMILHMNEKYDDTFTFVREVGQRFGADIYRIVAASEKYPDDAVFVTWQKSKDVTVITDNYVGIIFQEQTKNVIKELMTEEFGEKVFFEYIVNGFPLTPEFDEKTSFETYATDVRSGIRFNAIVLVDSPVVDTDEMETRIRKVFGSNRICCSGCVYFTDKEEDLGKISGDDGFGLYFQKHSYITRCEVVMKNCTEFNMINWEKRNGR